jgi:hypothetical protein
MATQRKETWTAIYEPDGQRHESKFDLPSKEAALEYVFAHMCEPCKENRRLALKIKAEGRATIREDMRADEYPGCFWEWLILKTKDLKQAKYQSDVMEAAGYKLIYKRS